MSGWNFSTIWPTYLRIAERGTHIRLLASGGLYASMWNRQREAEEAREKLAQIGDSAPAPHPELATPIDDVDSDRRPLPLIAPTAAE